MNNILHSRRGSRLFAAFAAIFAASVVSSVAQSPKAGNVDRQGVLWGRNAPGVLADTAHLNLLQLFAPEWVKQNLVYPSDLEQSIYEGMCDYEQRLEFASALKEVFARQLPGELIDHAVVMRGWQVLYNSWDKNVGADAFVVRFSSADYVYHVSETPSKVIVLVRPMRPETIKANSPVEFALAVAREVLKASVVPKNDGLVRSNAHNQLAGAFEGSWGGERAPAKPAAPSAPPVAAAALGSGTANPFAAGMVNAEPGASESPTVEFFVQGDLCAYLVDKGLFTRNPPHALTRRFQSAEPNLTDDEVIGRLELEMVRNPALSDPGDRVAYYERLRRHLNIRTAEEFLGPLLFDSEGNRLTVDKLDYQLLASSIEDLNADQRAILLRQRQVDWHYIEGLKAFETGNSRLAIDHWARALDRDPLNVRVALLLEIAAKERLHREFGGDWEVARQRGDTQLASVGQLLLSHNRRVVKQAMRQAEDQRVEDEVNGLRVEALKLYEEGLYEASRDRWLEILRLAPDDSTALLYANLMEMKLKQPESKDAMSQAVRGSGAASSKKR